MRLEHATFLVEEQLVQLGLDVRGTILEAKHVAQVGDDVLKFLLPGRVAQVELTRVQLSSVSELGIDDGLRAFAERCLSASIHDRLGIS